MAITLKTPFSGTKPSMVLQNIFDDISKHVFAVRARSRDIVLKLQHGYNTRTNLCARGPLILSHEIAFHLPPPSS